MGIAARVPACRARAKVSAAKTPRSNGLRVQEMLRKKPKKKERIKVSMRVQLKNVITSNGEVVGKGAAKGTCCRLALL